MALLLTNSNLTPEYFLDEMSFQTVESFINKINKNKENELELMRFSAFLISRNFSDIKKPTDLIKFSWENIQEVEQAELEDPEQVQKRLLDIFNNSK